MLSAQLYEDTLQHEIHGAAAIAGTAPVPSQRYPPQKANNRYKSHAPQRSTEQQPAAAAAAAAIDVAAPAARAATGSSQPAEVSGVVATIPMGIAPTQAVLAAPRQTPGRRRKQAQAASLLRQATDDLAASSSGTMMHSSADADMNAAQQQDGSNQQQPPAGPLIVQPQLPLLGQLGSDTAQLVAALCPTAEGDMQPLDIIQQRPPGGPLVTQPQESLSGSQHGSDTAQLIAQGQLQQQLITVENADDVADAEDWTDHDDILAPAEPAETAQMQLPTADSSSLPSDMEDYVPDILNDLDNKQDPVELHGIVRKLIASLRDSGRYATQLQKALTTMVQGCDASANTLQSLSGTALATLQCGSGQAPDQQLTGGKYDSWTLSVFRVSGPHMSFFPSSVEGSVQIWVLKLTAPTTPTTASTNSADEAAVHYLFVPEDALNLLGMSAEESALKGHKQKVQYCGSFAAHTCTMPDSFFVLINTLI